MLAILWSPKGGRPSVTFWLCIVKGWTAIQPQSIQSLLLYTQELADAKSPQYACASVRPSYCCVSQISTLLAHLLLHADEAPRGRVFPSVKPDLPIHQGEQRMVCALQQTSTGASWCCLVSHCSVQHGLACNHWRLPDGIVSSHGKTGFPSQDL